MRFSDLKTRLVKNDLSSIAVKTYIPIMKKADILPQIAQNVLVSDQGYFMIDRVQYELNLYYLFCILYLDIEFEKDENGIDKFTSEDYDALAIYKFKRWLISESQNDAFEFEQLYKNAVLDAVRKANARTPEVDMAQMQGIIDQLNKVDPRIFQLIDADGTKIPQIASEMMKSERKD
jgi:hypothetical protein